MGSLASKKSADLSSAPAEITSMSTSMTGKFVLIIFYQQLLLRNLSSGYDDLCLLSLVIRVIACFEKVCHPYDSSLSKRWKL